VATPGSGARQGHSPSKEARRVDQGKADVSLPGVLEPVQTVELNRARIVGVEELYRAGRDDGLIGRCDQRLQRAFHLLSEGDFMFA